MSGFQLCGVNRDGCHMWGNKCSLFPEDLISLPLSPKFNVHDFTHSLYTLYITEFVSFRTILRIDGLFVWISLTALSRTYCIDSYWSWIGHSKLLELVLHSVVRIHVCMYPKMT